MEQPVVTGQKRSKFYFNKIEIYKDRMEAKSILMPKKTIYLNEITSWTEVNKQHRKAANLKWTELIIYTSKTSYKIMSLHWKNYLQVKEALVRNKHRDVEKEKKILASYW